MTPRLALRLGLVPGNLALGDGPRLPDEPASQPAVVDLPSQRGWRESEPLTRFRQGEHLADRRDAAKVKEEVAPALGLPHDVRRALAVEGDEPAVVAMSALADRRAVALDDWLVLGCVHVSNIHAIVQMSRGFIHKCK